MNLKEIAKIVELMAEHDLTEFDIKCDDITLTIKRKRNHEDSATALVTAIPNMQPVVTQPSIVAPVPLPVVGSVQAAAAATAADNHRECIESPVLGTFYRAPAPDADPFVNIGDHVEVGQVVCVVEAMKQMNEVTADKKGTICEVLVENGKPVEFGQPLFSIEPQ